MADYAFNTTAALHGERVTGQTRALRAEKHKRKHPRDKFNTYMFVCVVAFLYPVGSPQE